jgi:K+-sensing histidine kinase KdpD
MTRLLARLPVKTNCKGQGNASDVFASPQMISWKPIALSFGSVSLTTAILVAVDNGAELEHLEIAYLFPTAVIAVCYGSNFAFMTSSASALATAYFLFPPRFSFYIANPLHIAELGFFVLVALIAGKIVSLLAHDAPESLLEAWRRNRGRREGARKARGLSRLWQI